MVVYHTFSNRIKAEALELQQSSASLPALEFLRSQASRYGIALTHIDLFIPPRAFILRKSLSSHAQQSNTSDVVKYVEEESKLVERPNWLFLVMSSLIILSDHCLFPHPDTFKIFMRLAVLGFAYVRWVVRGLAERL